MAHLISKLTSIIEQYVYSMTHNSMICSVACNDLINCCIPLKLGVHVHVSKLPDKLMLDENWWYIMIVSLTQYIAVQLYKSSHELEHSLLKVMYYTQYCLYITLKVERG